MSNILNSTGYPFYEPNMIRGEGCYVYDQDEKAYLDLEAGVWALPLGHCDKEINAAMHEQIDKLMHVGYKYNHPIVEDCAKKLLEITGLDGGKCVFLTSGSEAVEYGIQLAKLINKEKCLCLSGQYFSAYGSCMERPESEWVQIKWSDKDEKTAGEYEKQLRQEIDFSRIGIFVFEAGNSSGLVKLPPKNLVKAIVRITKEQEILTLVDEVTCGIGRTGEWFGYMHYEMKPEIIAVGKGLGNGYPVSAVILEKDVARKAKEAGFDFGLSHQNDPLGARVAYEVLSKVERLHLCEKSRQAGAYFLESYQKLQKEILIIKEVRGRGLMLCIELEKSVSKEQMRKMERALFSHGFIVAVKPVQRVIRTYAPLIITTQMIDTYIEEIRKLLLIFQKEVENETD